MRTARIDQELAAGVATWRSPAHSERALRLTSRRNRRVVAASLERLLRDVDSPPAVSARVPPCRKQVIVARAAIDVLIARLRSEQPIDARGVARLLAILTDGTGPCYVRSHPRALLVALETAGQWLNAPD